MYRIDYMQVWVMRSHNSRVPPSDNLEIISYLRVFFLATMEEVIGESLLDEFFSPDIMNIFDPQTEEQPLIDQY